MALRYPLTRFTATLSLFLARVQRPDGRLKDAHLALLLIAAGTTSARLSQF
jgi:hypothetical protein